MMDRMKPRILFVDDNADLREVLVARLTAAGYEVVSAGSGQEGLELATQTAFDLVLLDMLMPQQDGIATYHAFRANAPTQTVPVILFTAMAVEGHWEALPDEQGAPCFVMGKPYDLSLLLARISQVLQRTAEGSEEV